MAYAIEAEDLVKIYSAGRRGGRVVALDRLSFTVDAGSVFGLLGPNGAGKSTAVKILTTLSKPQSGRARVAGIDVLREPDRVRRLIGAVSQKSGLDREATGRENMILQGRLFGMNSGELNRRTDELLERFGLTDAANRVVRTYSGGMQRRLDVAMGLVNRPQVLFLDEPTTGLDPEARAEMWKEIRDLAAQGLTILLTTHYLEEADSLAKRLAIIDRGRVVAQGTPAELKADLKGDSVNVVLCEADIEEPISPDRVRNALEPVKEVGELTIEGCHVRARADDGARAVPAVLQALEAQDLPVSAVTISRPSLDDVYLRLTGRSFEEADVSGEQAKR